MEITRFGFHKHETTITEEGPILTQRKAFPPKNEDASVKMPVP